PTPHSNAYPQHQLPHQQQQAPGMAPLGQQSPSVLYGSYAPPPPHQHQQGTPDYLTQPAQLPGGVPQYHGQSQQPPQGHPFHPQQSSTTHNADRNQTGNLMD
ncbi:hypothetical protein IWQ61_010152, partial [Dispira simplex]